MHFDGVDDVDVAPALEKPLDEAFPVGCIQFLVQKTGDVFRIDLVLLQKLPKCRHFPVGDEVHFVNEIDQKLIRHGAPRLLRRLDLTSWRVASEAGVRHLLGAFSLDGVVLGVSGSVFDFLTSKKISSSIKSATI